LTTGNVAFACGTDPSDLAGFLATMRLLVTYWRAAASYDCGGSPMSDRLFLARRR